MSRLTTVPRALLLLILLAAAFLWAGDQGIRAAASDRADSSATAANSTAKAVSGEAAPAATPARPQAVDP